MKTKHGLLRLIAGFGVMLMMGGCMSAEAGFLGFGGDSWKEEVLLHDGKKIIVKRSQSYGGRHEVGQASPIKSHTISFILPNSSKTFAWVSEYSEDVGRANFDLIALHVLNSTPYIVTSPAGCLSYNKWGRPNPPYVLFKYDGKDWQHIQMSELPAEFKTVNIDVGMPWDIRDREVKFDKGDLLTAETIKRHNENNHNSAHKTILREAYAGAAGECPDFSSQQYRSPKAPMPIKPVTNK